MRRAFVCSTVLMAAFALVPVSAGAPDALDWLLVRPPASPAARDAHAMAYDSKRDRVVLFAGANEYNSHRFRGHVGVGRRRLDRANAADEPAAALRARDGLRRRARPRRAVRRLRLSFRHRALGDTWEWDGTTGPSGRRPRPAGAHRLTRMAYDSARGRVVLFGGAGDSGSSRRHVGVGRHDWTERTPPASPPPREYGALTLRRGARPGRALRRVRRRLPYLGDTWEWDGDDLDRARPQQPIRPGERGRRSRSTSAAAAPCSSAATTATSCSATPGSGTGTPGSKRRRPTAPPRASWHAMVYDRSREPRRALRGI